MTKNDIRFSEATQEQQAQWWRDVHGEYPTGVAIISALDADGEPQGTVVGTFASVSLDPPLVSFMPMRSSRSYSAIRDTEYFRVSVLGSGHEDLCRAFATAPPESRFAVGEWESDERGIPHLVDSVVWFSCKRSQTIEAGDHDIVLGEVLDLGFGDGRAGMPLVFLKGGYGSFSIPRLDFQPQSFGTHLRLADEVKSLVQQLAEQLGTRVTLGTVVKDSVVILSAANLQAQKSMVGENFPFAAPLSPAMAAWSSPAREKAWRAAGKSIGFDRNDLLDAILAQVRERGYAVSIGATVAHRFDKILRKPNRDSSELGKLWANMAEEHAASASDPNWAGQVTSVQLPIFDADGRADLTLAVSGLQLGMSTDKLDSIVVQARSVAGKISKLL
ncbi:flavin reductase [Nocardia pseudovaccinii]|uniref:flavin reductase n=1 Tax=Nocardia pseudovaccinii TaxID=189540 RepID=UPI003D929E0C